MSQLLMGIKGIAGQIELYDDKIMIKREGAHAKLTHGFKGDKTIYIDQVSGVQLKLGTNMLNGYIQITIPGGNESRGGIMVATKDENTVFFKKAQNNAATRIKDKIEELRNQARMGTQTVVQQQSIPEQIKAFKELYEDGILTEEEFEKKKKELLNM